MEDGNPIHPAEHWLYVGYLLTDDELALIVEEAMSIGPDWMSDPPLGAYAGDAPLPVADDGNDDGTT